MSDRIVVMAEGAIRQVGTPSEIYLAPADPFVANFVGDANVIPVDYVGQNADGDSTYRIPNGDLLSARGDPAQCRQAKRLLLRPESIGLAPAGSTPSANSLRAVLVSTAYMGAYTELRARLGSQEILVKLPAGPRAQAMTVGDSIQLTYHASAARPLGA
jgi:ABC-type Fe3+/spermidine/putrescine transport system ATPase subunit